MTVTIKHRRSATDGAVPTTGSIELGEIFLNTYNGLLFFKKDDGTPSIVQIGAGGGGGGGISSLGGLTAATQTFATGTSGTNFAISSSTSTHTFNLPDASTTARGVVTTGTQTFTGLKTFSSPATSSKVLIVQGIASQTANLFEAQNSAGTALFSISASGAISAASTITAVGSINFGISGASSTLSTNGSYNGVSLGRSTTVGESGLALGSFVVCGTNEMRIGWGGGGTGRFFRGLSGGEVGVGVVTPLAQFHIETKATTMKGLLVRGLASQTANLFEVQNSSANNLLSVSPAGDVSVLGNLIVNGTTQTVNSTVVTIDDPVMTLGGDTAPTSDDNKDRGIEFRWHNGTGAKVGFFGYDDSTSKFTCIPDATNTSEVFSGAAGAAAFNTIESTVSTGTAPLTVASTTVCTNLNADTVDGYHASAFFLPAGMITAYGGSTAPSGWLLCQGQAVSRTTYADLFTAVGTAYGSGDGTSTFNLPDLQRRVPLGAGAAVGATDSLGGSDGIAAASRTLTHKHEVVGHYHGMGTGADLNITASGSGTSGNQSADHTHTFSATSGYMSANASHSHTVSDPGHVHNIWRSLDVPGGGSNRRGVSDTYTNPSAKMDTAYTGISLVSTDTNHTHSVSGTTAGVSANHTHTTPNHTHGSVDFAGRIGLVTGGVDGNSNQDTTSTAANYAVVNYIVKT